MTADQPRGVLVAGVGNVFLGDDGFGVAVVRHLAGRELPEGVTVADYGIRGLHLAYDLLDGRFSTLILVDAVPVDAPPGTIVVLEIYPETEDGAEAETEYCVEPQPEDGAEAEAGPRFAGVPDAHGMDPQTVLDLLRTLGGLGPGRVERVCLVGVRPARLEEEMGLSEPVASALERAAEAVFGLLGVATAAPVAHTYK
ncbi:hydrogenase maturation protease [Actinospica robiniae]|uniref:hydrogenase maturation protease n=1 Tax=Actinospica robiniae TaxID=304901 RepID=UPI0004214CDA|nr:hydrogenase maturation protease [Actinospica robiniae]